LLVSVGAPAGKVNLRTNNKISDDEKRLDFGRIFTAKILDKAGRLLYNTKAVKKKTLQQGA
jgi:hypothetical protein